MIPFIAASIEVIQFLEPVALGCGLKCGLSVGAIA